MRHDSDVNYAANPYGLPPEPKKRRLPVSLLATVSAVVLFGGVATWYFGIHRAVGLGGPPPVLEPDTAPMKSRPPETAGDDNNAVLQDRLVYERLAGTTRPTVERLLPPPEQPIPRPIVAPEPSTPRTPPRNAAGLASPPDDPAPTVSPPHAVPVPSAPTPSAPPPAPAAVSPGKPAAAPPAAASPSPPPTAAPPAVPAAPPASAAAPPPASTGGAGHWRVQLASVRSEVEATAEWKRLSTRYPEALGGLSIIVTKADLGEKGVYYRVQGGSVDENRARSICDQLKSQNVGCVVVRP